MACARASQGRSRGSTGAGRGSERGFKVSVRTAVVLMVLLGVGSPCLLPCSVLALLLQRLASHLLTEFNAMWRAGSAPSTSCTKVALAHLRTRFECVQNRDECLQKDCTLVHSAIPLHCCMSMPSYSPRRGVWCTAQVTAGSGQAASTTRYPLRSDKAAACCFFESLCCVMSLCFPERYVVCGVCSH